MNLEELEREVRRKLKEIDEVKLYYTLKELGVKRIGDLDTFKICVALHESNVPITSGSVAYFLNISTLNALLKLHRLGDLGFLLQRSSSPVYLWSLHPRFKIKYYGERTE